MISGFIFLVPDPYPVLMQLICSYVFFLFEMDLCNVTEE